MAKNHVVRIVAAAICAMLFAADTRGEQRSVLPQIKVESERVLTSSQPVNLLRIGNQTVLLSGGAASVLSANGEPKPIAGGRDIRDFGVACEAHAAYAVGGSLSNQTSADVWQVTLNTDGLQWKRIASLPSPCSKAACAIVAGDLFVVGRVATGTNFFLKIKISDGTSSSIEPPPHFGEAYSLGAQVDALMLAGRDTEGASRIWRRKNGEWTLAKNPPEELQAMPPIPAGQAHLFYSTANKTNPILAYHTITDTWIALPGSEGETVAVSPLANGFMRAVRTPSGGLALRAETIVHPQRGLTIFDYVALAGYFAINILIGILCTKRKASSDDFFRGGGHIQWWALGVSYMATAISSISFMAYPATAYASNWLLIGVPVFQSASVIVAGIMFMGLYRRLNITTVFEYLDQRFNRTVRLLGAALMIFGQVGGRMSIILLLPSMAFSAVSGLNVYVSVWLMGTVIVIYCLTGGMKAVVWADVFQFALVYGSIAIALLTVAHNVPGGFGGMITAAHEAGKFQAFLLDWDFVQPSIWVFCCLSVTTVFLQLGDQALMQRALSAPNEKAARNTVILAGFLNPPVGIMLFFIGSALFVFYRNHPGWLNPTLPNDSIFPFFVGSELPHGLVGLIIAGIFSAAMSAVGGSVNAISAIVVRDFVMPFRPNSTEKTRMRLARATTVIAGGLATIIATVMAGMNIKSLWETFAALMALIGGGFPGIFALGLLTRRTNAPGVTIGLLASIVITFAVRKYTATNVFLFTSVAVGSCMAVGYIASFFFASSAKPLAGLTIHTLPRKRGAGE